MAQSYQLISAQILTSGTQTITFSNIPQNYTDLRILFSARVNTSGGYSNVKIGFNGSTSNITWRGLYAYGGTNVGSNTGSTERVAGNANANSSTSATFSNVDVYITNYTSTSVAKTISGESVTESNDNTNPLLSLETNYWNPGTQAAITSIELTNSASPAANFDAGSTFYLYGIGGARASGGTITADANYTYHTFTSTGTFTALERIRGAEALVIAGGGGGGYAGGGGGAGGFRVVPGLLLPAGNTYAVTVGAGGTGGTGSGGITSSQTTSGSNSVFSNIISTGGGKGSSYDSTTGGNGGSGGGGGGGSSGNGGTGNGGSYSPSEGNTGGNGVTSNGGGGGGAGAVGTAGVNDFAGAGGIGSSAVHSWGYATSTGENVGNTYYYAGGGGGRGLNGGAGGSGGGGAGCSGSSNSGVAGTANTGGGGGSGGNSPAVGGNGGSGVVIIRYPNS